MKMLTFKQTRLFQAKMFLWNGTTESNMSTLWRREVFLRICRQEDLVEKAQAIQVTIQVKKSQE